MGRRKGTSAFPVARIKKMMQSDDDVGKIATVTPMLVAKALECMMEHVLTEAAQVARDRHTRTVTPQHLRHCVVSNDAFDFLRPTLAHVPPLEEGGKVRRKRPRSPLGGENKVKRNRGKVEEGEEEEVVEGGANDALVMSSGSAVGAAEMEVGKLAGKVDVCASVEQKVERMEEEDDDDDYDEEEVQGDGSKGGGGAGDTAPHNASERVSVHALLS